MTQIVSLLAKLLFLLAYGLYLPVREGGVITATVATEKTVEKIRTRTRTSGPDLDIDHACSFLINRISKLRLYIHGY